MSNIRFLRPGGRLATSTVVILLFLLTAIIGGLGYLFYLPLMQVYWGVHTRLKPFVSFDSLDTEHVLLGRLAGPMIHKPLREGFDIEPYADDYDDYGDGNLQGGTSGQQSSSTEGSSGEAKEDGQDGATAKGGEAAPKDAPQLLLEKLQKQDNVGGPLSELAQQHRLTRELAASRALDNVVVVTWANYYYRDFVMNWVEHLMATNCTSFLVGAMDDKLLQFLLDRQVPAFSMGSGLTTEDFGWGTPTFHKMGREKIHLIHTFTSMGFSILVSDVDTVWMRDPLPYMARYPEADILTSSDHLTNTDTDEGLEHWERAMSAANIGIMLFRPAAKGLAEEWVQMLDKDAAVWDQNAFNELFVRGWKPLPDRQDRLFLGYDGKLKMGILPVSLFCSGHTFYVQHLPTRLHLQPFVVHGTFQFSGTPGKRHRMREALLFNDPPEYFNRQGGFIAVEPSVPKELLDACATNTKDGSLDSTLPHFNLVNHQLLQIRAEFAVARLLGRAAILPPLWCGMDRWWSPHTGVIPGSTLDLPFLCPADHVLDLEVIEREGLVEYREHSFLENPRSAALQESIATVVVCQEGEAGCSDGSAPAAVAEGVVKLAPGLKAAKIREALSEAMRQYKVLKFRGIERAFGGWDTPEQDGDFQARLQSFVSIWCCVDRHPGHVWYDFWWDKVPHTDRHNRLYDKPWTPVTGP